MQWFKIWVWGIIVLGCSHAGWAEDCREATRLAQQAYQLGAAPETFPEQKRLLLRALELCPQHPEAHTNLADIFEKEQNFAPALTHYQTAVRLKPELAAAWVGIGDVYSKTGQLTLSLEAYLHACQQDADARQRIAELLTNNRYRVVEEGKILDKASLLLLFDKERRDNINTMLQACHFRDSSAFRAEVEPELIFRNILFDPGKATLKPESSRQIQEIAAALVELRDAPVMLNGHTDKQPFKGYSAAESLPLNMQLSTDRAASVADQLVKLGVPRSRLEIHGYGPTQPVSDEDTPAAYAQNRRVTVEVRE